MLGAWQSCRSLALGLAFQGRPRPSTSARLWVGPHAGFVATVDSRPDSISVAHLILLGSPSCLCGLSNHLPQSLESRLKFRLVQFATGVGVVSGQHHLREGCRIGQISQGHRGRIRGRHVSVGPLLYVLLHTAPGVFPAVVSRWGLGPRWGRVIDRRHSEEDQYDEWVIHD